MSLGYPEVYGETPAGFCGHCRASKQYSIVSAYGAFCGACFRWRTYLGPKQVWGDGMKVTQHRVIVIPINLD